MNLRNLASTGLALSLVAVPLTAYAGTKASHAMSTYSSHFSDQFGPPGHDEDHHNDKGKGNHYGWSKDHDDNGNHYGHYKSKGC